jgi:L-ascorbate metabolism protein UlaG (beta-lactamase superfamily)
MLVKFIAHAGIYIQEGESSLLIDPWFTDSSLEDPILESLGGGKTIDFQLPKTNERIETYAPAAVLVSHFHAHHAPARDILTLAERPTTRLFAYPDSPEGEVAKERLAKFAHLSTAAAKDGDTFGVGSLQVTALSHTNKNHLAWLIEGKDGKVLHLTDAFLSKDPTQIIDPVWQKFYGLKPDLAFIAAGRNSLRTKKAEFTERDIHESNTLSPIQAAKLAALIEPQTVALIGMYNHSVWKGRVEFIPNAALTEEEFYWALSWLCPSARFVRMFPGHTFTRGEASQ